MLPPSEFPVARPSFPAPVLPPATLPGDTPLVNVCVNVDWLPYICGALQQLLLQSTWIVASESDLIDLQSKVIDLIRLFNVATAPECREGMMFRQPDNCTLQYSTDGGTTWITIYDASACVAAGVPVGVAQLINDGILAGAPQQPPQGTGTTGQCYDWTITLHGSDRWHVPIAVDTGDTLEMLSASGGWADGTVFWQCPSGDLYTAGVCLGGSGGLNPADPLPLLDHMRTIWYFPDALIADQYHDAYDQLVSLPSGLTASAAYLQANDSALYDNQGSITVKVRLCKGIATAPAAYIADSGRGTSTPPLPALATSGATFDLESVYSAPELSHEIHFNFAEYANPGTPTPIQISLALSGYSPAISTNAWGYNTTETGFVLGAVGQAWPGINPAYHYTYIALNSQFAFSAVLGIT